MHNAHETKTNDQKNRQSTITQIKHKKVDKFWNILTSLDVSKINFESTMNDLNQISIVWNRFLTNVYWFRAIKNNNFN